MEALLTKTANYLLLNTSVAICAVTLREWNDFNNKIMLDFMAFFMMLNCSDIFTFVECGHDECSIA
jgi:hypothetical protein